MYQEDDMLMLSGIQHYMFCPRQWAFIHIGQYWVDNRLTAEGSKLHKNVDDPSYRQKNGDKITLRNIPIASKELGLYGQTDAVELIPSDNPSLSITHPRYPGIWVPLPVEYKRGRPKPDERDMIQVAAQAMCMEEQYQIQIHQGALFYWETNSRVYVPITAFLRNLVQTCAREMHSLFKKGMYPKAQKRPHCQQCSLLDVCMPTTRKTTSVHRYLEKNLYAETP